MWAVAQKCCWAPAKGPHKGSQIISLQCKCDDSGSRGSLAVQPPPPLPSSASPVLALGGYQEHCLQRGFGRHSALRAQSSSPSDFGTGTGISQDHYWPFPSGVFGVWQEARVGRTIPSRGPNTTLNKPSLLCVRMRGLAGAGGGAAAGQSRALSDGKGPRRSCHQQREQLHKPGSQTVTLCARYSTPGAEGGEGARRETSNEERKGLKRAERLGWRGLKEPDPLPEGKVRFNGMLRYRESREWWCYGEEKENLLYS